MDPCFVEEPVLFGRDRSLVGSVCRPVEISKDRRPYVVFLNSGIIHRAGPNRIYVGIARALAKTGVSSLRFDLSGIGDSVLPAGVRGMSIQERVEVDIDDALGFVRARYEVDRFVLIGLCSGADNALRTMGRVVDVVGAVLLDLNAHRTFGFYVRHYARRVVRLRSWLNIVAREGKLLCIFTAGLETQYNYRKQFLHLFPGLDFRDCLTLEYYADSDHTFSRLALQERLSKAIVDWLRETRFSRPTSG